MTAAEQREPGVEATGLLTVNLGALRGNYRFLRARAGGAECAAVVKADAYGLGAERVAPALMGDGCRTFFVATIEEARRLRPVVGDATKATIYVLDGLLPGAAAALAKADARPVLGSLPEIEEWASFCRRHGRRLPAALHIDTGMNRLGLGAAEVEALARRPDPLSAFEIALVMSHLACADEPEHPKNELQRAAFERLRSLLPPAPASLANSAGILLGENYLFDLVRPGIALYGGNPRVSGDNPMQPVVRLDGRIAQIRCVAAGESVGYGAGHTLARPTRIATVCVGYADGYMRCLGASDTTAGAVAYIEGRAAPLLGRVSMDLITIDVTDVPDCLVRRGSLVELIGPHVGVDELAVRARTIGYEILTSLGRRYARRYVE